MGLISLFIEDIYEIIEKKAKYFIVEEIYKCNILNEFDFQCKFVGYLRNEISKSKDSRWKIYNTFYLKASNKVPDILIFLNFTPLIFLELKYFGFNNPNREKVLKDLTKLHNYFSKYSLIVKRGYTFNVYSYSKQKDIEFERDLQNKINHKDIRVVNLNLKQLKEFEKIRSDNLKVIEMLRSKLKERLF